MNSLLSERYAYDGESEILLNSVQELALYEVKKKQNSGVYMFEEYECDCGTAANELITIAEKDRYGLKLYTKICPHCGLVMTNPRMSQNSYNQFYDSEYRRLYSGRPAMSDAFFQKQYKRGKAIYEFVDKQYDMTFINNVLEIGCGAGGILKYFADKGIRTKGIDLGTQYIKYGIDRGLDLQCGPSADLIREGTYKYDLIILHHVFEHFLDVQSELRVIKQLLSEDGILFIAVPGIESITDDYDGNILRFLQNAHIRHFTLSTLKQLMERNEFELVAGSEKIMSIFKYNRTIEFTCQNHYKDVMQKLKEIEFQYSKSTHSQGEIKKYQMMNNKLNKIIEIQKQWFCRYCQDKSIYKWLSARGIRNIAIYGFGVLGESLYKALENSEVKISYIIDARELLFEDIKQYFPNESLPDVDAVIITPVSQYMEIESVIKKGNPDLQVIKLIDIVNEL